MKEETTETTSSGVEESLEENKNSTQWVNKETQWVNKETQWIGRDG